MTPEPLSFIEQALLRQHGAHTLLRMVAGAAEDAISEAKSGWSGSTTTLMGRRGWAQTGAKGIGWSENFVYVSAKPAAYEVFVTWQRLKAHARLVATEPLIEDCAEYERLSQEHAMDAYHHSCPNKAKDPEGNAAYHQWWDDVHMSSARALDVMGKGLTDRILPSLIDWEEESESLPSD